MDPDFFENLASAKHYIPNPGKFTVSIEIPGDHAGVMIAEGASLQTAKVSFFSKGGAKPFTITPEFSPDGKSLKQFFWFFTYLVPGSNAEASRVGFGVGVGEENHDIADVKVVESSAITSLPPVLGKVPQEQLVPGSYQLSKLQRLSSTQENSRTISVVHGDKVAGAIQDHAVVILYDRSTGNIYGVWDGHRYKTPITVPVADSNDWTMFSVIAPVAGKIFSFNFSVGDPRREAKVVIENDDDEA